jgi:CubicO group peptidase (beta-lactamase class C family)
VLVDDGKLRWDDKVIDHMPWFRMYDPWVTNEMTVRDLLVHRSGLGLGAGDLMFIPTSSRSRADTVRRLRYIKPATSFRSGYAYDNVLYSVAGQLIEEVTGQTWEVFVRERVLKPAGMTSSVTEQSARFANPNRAWPHARTSGRVRGMGEQAVLDERKTLGDNGAPAGGLSSSANDLAHWMQVQLGHGAWTNAAGKEVRVFSEQSAQQMWTPVVPTPTPKYPGKLAEAAPKFSSYALGWSVRDYRGEKVIEHGGAIFGVYTYIALFPDRDFGVAFQMNSEDVQVMRGVALEVIDHYLGAPKTDWVAAFDEFLDQRTEGGLAALDAAQRRRPPRRASRRSRKPAMRVVMPTVVRPHHHHERERRPACELPADAGPHRSPGARAVRHLPHGVGQPGVRTGVRELRSGCRGQGRAHHDEDDLADRRLQLGLPGSALHAVAEILTVKAG